MEEKQRWKPIKIVAKGGSGEMIEKQSRFIATVRPVETEEMAVSFIGEMKKKYWDASHNCSAYVLGDRGELMQCRDDGEPAGTAGRPMLEVLLGEEIRNVAVVVTRYFGGTLLGTGGLARAYSGAVKQGLANSLIVWKRFGIKVRIRTDYSSMGKLQYMLAQKDIAEIEILYTDVVEFNILLPEELCGILEKEIAEVTCGKAQMEKLHNLYFIDKKLTV